MAPATNGRSVLARSSCYLPPEEYRVSLEKAGQDAVICTLSWKPKPREPDREGVVVIAQEGIVRDRADLGQLPPPPSQAEMLGALDCYLGTFAGSAVGVGVLLRSVLYHCCGNSKSFIPMAIDMGDVGFPSAAAELQGHLRVPEEARDTRLGPMGNVDLAGVLARGHPNRSTLAELEQN